MMNLLDTPDAGVLRIADSEFSFPSSLSTAEFNRQAQALRRKVGMVFQQYNLWPHLTVMENLIEAPVKVLGMSREAAIEGAICWPSCNWPTNGTPGPHGFPVASSSGSPLPGP
jgi:ABC-type arginine transport system ATPase subunit